MAAEFEIYKDTAGEHRFRLLAGNNQNTLASEGYVNKAGAENGIASVKTNAPLDDRYQKKTFTSSKSYFVLSSHTSARGEPGTGFNRSHFCQGSDSSSRPATTRSSAPQHKPDVHLEHISRRGDRGRQAQRPAAPTTDLTRLI